MLGLLVAQVGAVFVELPGEVVGGLAFENTGPGGCYGEDGGFDAQVFHYLFGFDGVPRLGWASCLGRLVIRYSQ